jgi:cytochrome c oxidase cbb3-type subunit 3
MTINSLKLKLTAIAAALTPVLLSAQDNTKGEVVTQTVFSNGVFLVMLGVIVMLAFVIIGMSEFVKAGASLKVKQSKAEGSASKNTIAMIALLLISASAFAQDAAVPAAEAAPEVPFDYWGLGAITFFVMLSVIIVQLVIVYMLYRTGINLIRKEADYTKTVAEKAASAIMETEIMRSITDAQAPEVEAALLMDHDYDGIQELDNNLPPWWKYGFYLTIFVGIAYLINYHVLHTGKTQAQEYDQEVVDAEKRIAEYKKANANLVDESNVTALTDAAAISSGKGVFTANCAMCHGDAGEGKEGLGPNLTDDYWIHKGGIVNVFKSIKYGWTDKGMKSWEQDLKPLEIQQVSSYILSLRGSKPANAKAPEGELWVEEGETPAADSAATDSMQADSIQPKADTVKK